MPGNKNFSIFFSLAIGMTTEMLCAVETQVTQPIGTLVRTWQPTGALPFAIQPPVPPNPQPVPPVTPFDPPTTPLEEVNYICAQWDNGVRQVTVPYDINYPVTEIILTQPQHFVRLIATPTSSSNGAWIMRSQYVRGKTPAQLRNIFALAHEPIAIVNVEMPASPDPVTGKNYVLWTGIAAPIRDPNYDWGDGGSVQERLVADYGTNYFPTYRFTNSDTRNHRQSIGDYALSYRPLAGGGNTYCVASYLDTYVPDAYSDLENVYHALDYLNYIDYGPIPLQNALHQISPERYDAVWFVAFRNALLFSESILEWQIQHQWQNHWLNCIDQDKQQHTHWSFWLQNINEFNNGIPVNNCQPVGSCDDFCYHTNGLLGCLDWRIRERVAIGISIGGLKDSLSWCDNNGTARGSSALGSIYTCYTPKNFFIDGMISGGGNWQSAHRHITFYAVDRTACSRPTGKNIAAHLQGGLSCWQWLTPRARLSYFFNNQKCFQECGADSLDLAVCNYKTHTLHATIGLEMSHVFESRRFTFVPQVHCAWAGDFFVRRHTLNAQLCGPTGCLYVHGMPQPGSYFVGSIELSLIMKHCNTLFARYEAQVRSKCAINVLTVGIQAHF